MHRTPFHRPLVAALALAVLAAGCAGSSKATKQDVTFPPPPQKARIRWVQSFRSEDDFKQSTWRKITKALVPYDTTATIVQPTAVALSPDEKTLYVALPHRSRVAAVDLVSGKFSGIGTSASAPLKRPIGVATDGDGNLYVSDKDANVVRVFSASGNALRAFGTEDLVGPTGIAVDRKRQLVYVVNDASTQDGRHTVEVFSLAGKHLRTMGGGRSDAPGSFFFPRSVTVAPSGDVYVGDTLNFRIQVFDSAGQLIRTFGSAGSGFPGSFDKIHSVALDTFGNVYVADAMQGIHIMNPVGAPLFLWGRGVIGQARGLVFDAQNRIYVSDLGHSIHIFDLVNTTAADSYPTKTPTPPAPTPPSATSAPGGKPAAGPKP